VAERTDESFNGKFRDEVSSNSFMVSTVLIRPNDGRRSDAALER
jgi:hypothetical protein